MAEGLSLGIEEEYLLVDLQTRDIVPEPPDSLLSACEQELGDQVHPEFLRCQLEVSTRVCGSLAEARADLARLRSTVARIARDHGMAPIAASAHPFAVWRPQKYTDRDRYKLLARALGAPVRRLMICGLHVHVGVPDPELRIDLMNQARYFLPHILALTTSSPFWQGHETGLYSYRLAVLQELPRTGMPETFASWGEYRQAVEVLVGTGVIRDGSELWWDIRPSVKFPTLEMRISDVCTRLDDSLTAAAIYVCLLGMLSRLRRENITWRPYRNMLIGENRWRAQRYGFDEGMVDFGRGELVGYPDLLEEILTLLAPDAEVHGCQAELANARQIVARGTSAHRQLAIFREARAAGADEREAFQKVVDWLVQETVEGV
ncbi:MAG TPA: carboxylate-amine ligase [Azospirillaceae bacterium]|nr:carboxylate-amine ligase [Azospirillaceae bacterium]